MSRTSPNSRGAGFTFVELLLALALGVLVATAVGALVHGLFFAGERQAARLQGAFAARAAVRALAREVACAFAPPDSKSIAAISSPANPFVFFMLFLSDNLRIQPRL